MLTRSCGRTTGFLTLCGCGVREATTNIAAQKFADGLPEVPPVQVLSERVTAALGMNPGPFTLMGSNTYLVGTGKKRILIDTGEGLDEYIPVLREAMSASGCEGIQEVLITHYHYDHVGGLESIQKAFGPGLKVSKYIPAASELRSYKESHSSPEASELHGSPLMSDSFDPVVDQSLIETEGATLRVIHTPGHTADHVAFFLEEEGSVFTGDCVLGAGTAVFGDLSEYMNSLNKILRYKPRELYCGHGPRVQDGTGWIQKYVDHRNGRERQILDTMRNADPSRTWSSLEVVEEVYRDTIPPHLKPAAAQNVSLHMGKLISENRGVESVPKGVQDGEPRYSLTSNGMGKASSAL